MNTEPIEELHPMIRLAMRLYNIGYNAGHHDTVESVFANVLEVDLENYHEEEAQEIVQDFCGCHEITEEELAEWAEFLEQNAN